MTIWVGKHVNGLNAYTSCGDWRVIDRASGEEVDGVVWVDDYAQEFIQIEEGEEVRKRGDFRLEYRGPWRP